MRLTKPTGGDPLSRMLARIIEAVQGQTIVESPDIRPEHSTRGVSLLLNRRNAGGGNGVEIFTITAVLDASLTCKKSDDLTGPDFTVTKPPELQAATYGIRHTRGDVQYEYITPTRRTVYYTTYPGAFPTIAESVKETYLAGDQILAVKVSGTWWDLNIGGRRWEAEPIETEICHGGQTKKTLMLRGAIYTR